MHSEINSSEIVVVIRIWPWKPVLNVLFEVDCCQIETTTEVFHGNYNMISIRNQQWRSDIIFGSQSLIDHNYSSLQNATLRDLLFLPPLALLFNFIPKKPSPDKEQKTVEASESASTSTSLDELFNCDLMLFNYSPSLDFFFDWKECGCGCLCLLSFSLASNTASASCGPQQIFLFREKTLLFQ